MLLLQYHNLLLKSVLTERILDPEDEAPTSSLDQIVSDFDNVTFHLSTAPDNKDQLFVSVRIKSWPDLEKYGAREVLAREYGTYLLSTPENGYDATIALDVSELRQNMALEQRRALVDSIALLKRNAMAAPFERAFAQYDELAKEAAEKSVDMYAPEQSTSEVMAVRYRENESIYVKAAHDRVTVVFSTGFRDETDRVFGRVFLQEFVDARRRAVQNAPQVLYSHREAPLDIREAVPPAEANSDVGFVTFVLFPRHLTPQRRENAISHIQTFRDYFHYHIKCSKAYMHSRMRFRVTEFLKVLNRAKPENAEEESGYRKTVTGRKFRVAA